MQHGQSRETGNIDEQKQSKNTTQYVLDTAMRKQTQITYKDMNRTTNEQQGPHQKTGGELRCSRKVFSSCFLLDTRRVTHIYSHVR